MVLEVLLSTADTHNALIVLELSTLTKARNDTTAVKVKDNERRGHPSTPGAPQRGGFLNRSLPPSPDLQGEIQWMEA